MKLEIRYERRLSDEELGERLETAEGHPLWDALMEVVNRKMVEANQGALDPGAKTEDRLHDLGGQWWLLELMREVKERVLHAKGEKKVSAEGEDDDT